MAERSADVGPFEGTLGGAEVSQFGEGEEGGAGAVETSGCGGRRLGGGTGGRGAILGGVLPGSEHAGLIEKWEGSGSRTAGAT